MYRVPVLNFIDKIPKYVTIRIEKEDEYRTLIDTLNGGDNREYQLPQLEGWYVASTYIGSANYMVVKVYRYDNKN